jgi:hypothetical protein
MGLEEPGVVRKVKSNLIIAALAILIVGCSGPSGASASPSLIASRTESPSASQLPALRMPGRGNVSSPGDYGWTGEEGSITGMHNVVGHGETEILFAVEDDCFASGEGAEPVSVKVAGLDGWYVEPFDGPGDEFWREHGFLVLPKREDGQTTGAYALPIDGRTLCVYLTWDALTTRDELDAARQVVESIRGQAYRDGIRVIFNPGYGWDTG